LAEEIKLEALRSHLAAGVKLTIESKRAALARVDQTDIWAEISVADLTMLSSTKPNRVGRAYKKVLAGALYFERDSARNKLRWSRDRAAFARPEHDRWFHIK
jgi:hypothetical protein